MVRNRNERQFDEYRDWQWIKHLILRKYAFLWSEILGKSYGEIVVVDTCAGAGSYTDPDTGSVISEGSPVIFARRAKEYTERRGPGKSMRVICCEKNRNNYTSLVETLRPFEPHVKTLPGGFEQHVPAIAQELGNAPALILLDPIGVGTIPADTWRPLLERKGKTDIFVVLHFAGLHRVGGWLLTDGSPNPAISGAKSGAATHDRVFNGPGWRAIALDPALMGEEHREERERRYVKLFFEQVIGARHRWKCYCEVKAQYTSPVKYWLVHASDDRKPYELMNDEIVAVNETLFAREHGGDGQLENFLEAELAAHHAYIERKIAHAALEYVAAAPGSVLPYGALDDLLLRRFVGRARSNVPWRVVKRLCKEGRLTREKKLGAAADPHEKITLPGSGARDAAKVVPIRSAA